MIGFRNLPRLGKRIKNSVVVLEVLKCLYVCGLSDLWLSKRASMAPSINWSWHWRPLTKFRGGNLHIFI